MVDRVCWGRARTEAGRFDSEITDPADGRRCGCCASSAGREDGGNVDVAAPNEIWGINLCRDALSVGSVRLLERSELPPEGG